MTQKHTDLTSASTADKAAGDKEIADMKKQLSDLQVWYSAYTEGHTPHDLKYASCHTPSKIYLHIYWNSLQAHTITLLTPLPPSTLLQ